MHPGCHCNKEHVISFDCSYAIWTWSATRLWLCGLLCKWSQTSYGRERERESIVKQLCRCTCSEIHGGHRRGWGDYVCWKRRRSRGASKEDRNASWAHVVERLRKIIGCIVSICYFPIYGWIIDLNLLSCGCWGVSLDPDESKLADYPT